MRRLSPFLPFVPDETVLSWVVRLAAFHIGGGPAAFLGDLGLSMARVSQFLRPDQVDRICTVTGQDPVPVHANNPISLGLVPGIGKHAYRLGEEVFSHSMKVAPGMRFCPTCLLGDRVAGLPRGSTRRHRLDWLFVPARTCPIHMLPLVWKGGASKFDRLPMIERYVPESDDELADLTATQQTRPPSELQVYVLDRLRGSSPEGGWLDGQAIEQAWRATEYLGAAILDHRRKADQLSEDDWDEAGRQGWTVVSKGEAAVADAIDGLLVSAGTKRAILSRGQATFGLLHDWLQPLRPIKEPGPIADLLRKVATENFSFHSGDVVYGKPMMDPPMTSVATVANRVRIDARKLRDRLFEIGAISTKEMSASCSMILIDWRVAAREAERLKWGVSVEKVAAVLHVSTDVVRALLRAGMLRKMDGVGDVSSAADPLIDCRDLQAITETVAALPRHAADFPWDHRSLGQQEITEGPDPALVVRALLDGRLVSAFRRTGYNGLGGVYFRPEDLRSGGQQVEAAKP